MRHLFGKEHKEQKSMKLVKKLQLEEDKIWQEELQRRLEQEEKDAAFARELQEQIASDNAASTSPTSTAPSGAAAADNTITMSPSPVTIPAFNNSPSPVTSSPPPLPAKPTAYHSGTSSSNNSRSNAQVIHLQPTPVISNSTPSSSSSSMPQRDIPPPPYQNGQPRLPPRERTISQLSQQYGSSSNLINNTTTTIATAAASAPPLSPPSSQTSHHTAYLPALNTAVTPGIGHQTLNPQPYYPPTPHQQHQPPLYPPSTPQTQPQQPTFQAPRRDPAMLIIPPRKEKQPPVTVTSQGGPSYTSSSSMPMPEPVRANTPFQYSTAATPSYSSVVNLTSTPAISNVSGMTSPPPTTTTTTGAIMTPKPAPLLNHRSHKPTPTPIQRPPMTLTNSYHSLPISSSTTSDGMVTHISPNTSTNNSIPRPPAAPTPSHLLQPSGAKPDTKLDTQKGKSAMTTATFNNSIIHPSLAPTTVKTRDNEEEDEKDDDDDDEPLFWERNDGRMMASTPSIPPSALAVATTSKQLKDDDDHSNEQQQHNEKHMADPQFQGDADDYDSGSGSDDDDDDDDDQAIDLFNIRASDNVIIHQHNISHTNKAAMTTTGLTSQDMEHQGQQDDPFADSFAVDNHHHHSKDSNKSEAPSTLISHERSRSTGIIDTKPSTPFQMSNKSSTIAKVHDPLLMMASAKKTTGTPAPASDHHPSRPVSTVPWTSASFASSSVSMFSTPQQQQHHQPPIGSTIPRPASVYQHPLHQPKPDDDDDLITLDSDDIQPVIPTNVVRAGAPPNIQSMINQVTAEVPQNEFGYYHYQIDKPGGEKEEIEDAGIKALPRLPKTHPDHRHITVPSVIEDQRVWIRVHPTDTGKALASRIHIVATYKTRKILSITTDKGKSIALDDTPVFQDWTGVMDMEDGAPWKVEWTVMDHNLWEGPKEFLRYLKASLRS